MTNQTSYHKLRVPASVSNNLLPDQIQHATSGLAGLSQFQHPEVGTHRKNFVVIGSIPSYIRILCVEYPLSTSLKHLNPCTLIESNFRHTPSVIHSVSIWGKRIEHLDLIDIHSDSSDLKELVQCVDVPVCHPHNNGKGGLAFCTVTVVGSTGS